MKTPVKIIKREGRKVTHDVAVSSSRTKPQRTPEVMVKNWVIESRERRRADLNHSFLVSSINVQSPVAGRVSGVMSPRFLLSLLVTFSTR